MNYTQEDIKLLAKCGWMEARGEGTMGMLAVMHCVANRVGAVGFPKTLSQVIFSPNAFSWTRADNPEYGLEPPADDPQYLTALDDAEFVLAGESDVTRGALYYSNESCLMSNSWYCRNIIDNPEHPVTVVLGRHTFRK